MFQKMNYEIISGTIRKGYKPSIEKDLNVKIEKSMVLQPQNTCDVSSHIESSLTIHFLLKLALNWPI